jgi:hypothetical protein
VRSKPASEYEVVKTLRILLSQDPQYFDTAFAEAVKTLAPARKAGSTVRFSLLQKLTEYS